MQDTHAPSEQTRIRYLDALRGLMLVIMTLDHLEGPMKSITFQPLGFVSAAAGFIFLSGFVYGVVYTRKYLDTDFRTIKDKSGRRAVVIYLYHLLVLILVLAPYLMGFYESESLTKFRDWPVRSAFLFLLLLVQPSNMDILPMYIIFILTGPYVLRAIISGKWRVVIILSGLIWLVSQVHVFQYNRYDGGDRWIDLGHFNIFCWQLLFFVGIFFGYAKVTGKFRLPVSQWIVTIVFLCTVIFLIVRWLPATSSLFLLFDYYSDRSTLGVIRLVNFTLLAYLAYAVTQKLPDFIRSGWLELLGRHSLQVFAYSVCLAYYFNSAIRLPQEMDIWQGILFDLLLVSTLTLPAFLHQYFRKRLQSFKNVGF